MATNWSTTTQSVLVTGSNGFVGRGIVAHLSERPEYAIKAATRRPHSWPSDTVTPVLVGDIGPETDWSAAVSGVDVVIHTAARVHVMQERARNPLTEFRRVNVQGTVNLARQAADHGVKRLVFLSSIKVNGERTEPGSPFTRDSQPAPRDSYGVSKLEAEEQLRRIADSSGMEVVFIRPVLVYGPGAKGNFRSMMRWLERGIPLPLGAIDNLRSLVALDNLVDLVARCTRHPNAANRCFLVSDGEDVSTPELLVRLAAALGRRARILPVPLPLLRLAATAAGRGDMGRRLTDSLQVDIGATRRDLDWSPAVRVDDALRATANDFLGR